MPTLRNPKHEKSPISLAKTILLLTCWAALASIQAATHYVDSVAGDDNNAGTTQEAPWRTLNKVNGTVFQPGDAILFKAGSSWTGTLALHGSGSAGNPITVGRYGSGPKPLFHGEGQVVNTVELIDVSYWEIADLEITNEGDPGNYHNGLKVSYTATGSPPARQHHIYLRRLEVHNVDTFSNSGGGGIRMDAVLSDVLIDGCVVTNVGGNGIDVHSDWGWVVPKVQAAWDQVALEDIVIQNCTTSFCGDSGIWIWGAKRAVIQYCTAHDCNLGARGAYVGIWIMYTEDSVIQYNNSYRHKKSADGQCIDVDVLNFRTIVQGNYVHDNDYVGIMVFGYGKDMPTDDVTIRYNIAENCRYAFAVYGDQLGNTLWHNNTSYAPSWQVISIAYAGRFSGTHRFENNIFYGGDFDLDPDDEGSFALPFHSNAYFSVDVQPSDPLAITADPRLADPGSGGETRESVEGYRLLAGSPCVDAGVELGGTTDYFGSPAPVGSRDIGAHEFQSAHSPPAAPTNLRVIEN